MFKICNTYIFPLKMFWLVNRAIITVSFGIIREHRNINMTKSKCQSKLVSRYLEKCSTLYHSV